MTRSQLAVFPHRHIRPSRNLPIDETSDLLATSMAWLVYPPILFVNTNIAHSQGLAMNAGVPVASLLVRDSITPSSVALAAAAWT
jgi:hypothetical protein